MVMLIAAHTGHFPAQTFSGTVWLLQIRREDGWTTLTVTGLSTIPVAEWMAWARTIWCEAQVPTPGLVENGWTGSGPLHP